MDKLIHFVICTALTAAINTAVDTNSAVGLSVGVAVGKEVGDYMNYGRDVGGKEFAKMAAGDLLADGLGIAAGLAVSEFWE